MSLLGRLGRGTVRTIAILLAVVVALELIYLVVGNLLLRGDFVTRRVNKRPEKMVVSYESAYTLFPGHVAVTGLRLRNQATKSQLEAVADRVSAVLNPIPLMWKTVNIARARVQGAEFRMRSRPQTLEALQEKAASMPPIEGLDWQDALRDPDAQPKLPKWGVSVTSARVDDVRQVWINEFRVDGPGRAGAGVSVGPGRRLAISGGWVEFPRLNATIAGMASLSDVDLKAKLGIDSYDYGEHRGLGFLPYTSATIGLRGTSGKRMALLNYLFRHVKGIEFSGDPKQQEIQLVLEKGKLKPGTRATIATDRLNVKLFAYQAEGAAEVTAEVVEEAGTPRTKVEVRLTDYGFGLTEFGADGAQGERLQLLATTGADLSFDGTPEVDLDVEIVNLRMDDLRRANYLIPDGTRLTIEGGKARVDARIKASTQRSDGAGKVTFDTSALRLDSGGTKVGGHVAGTIPIRGLDLAKGHFAFDGTKIKLDKFELHAAASEEGSEASEGTTGWWAEFDVPKGRVDYKPDLRIRGDIAFSMRDTNPLVQFFTAKKPLPKIGERILEVEDVTGSAGIAYSGDRLSIRHAQVQGDDLEVQAQLDIAGKSVQGDLLAVYEFIGVGVELRGNHQKLHLTGARHWYESQVPGAHPKPSHEKAEASEPADGKEPEGPPAEKEKKEEKKGWFSRTFSGK